MAFSLSTLAYAFVGGVLPTFFWLWFWLKNDDHPEPRLLVAIAFVVGAITVPVVIPIEIGADSLLFSETSKIVAIATIEEVVKFALIAIVIFPSRFVDEPVDYGAYLITGALGFAALENMLFLINPLLDNNVALTLATGNLRFFGATALHALAGAIMGIAMGMVFYESRGLKVIFTILGIGAAILLHALFNFFIIQPGATQIIGTIAVLWVLTFLVVALFRRLRYLTPT